MYILNAFLRYLFIVGSHVRAGRKNRRGGRHPANFNHRSINALEAIVSMSRAVMRIANVQQVPARGRRFFPRRGNQNRGGRGGAQNAGARADRHQFNRHEIRQAPEQNANAENHDQPPIGEVAEVQQREIQNHVNPNVLANDPTPAAREQNAARGKYLFK